MRTSYSCSLQPEPVEAVPSEGNRPMSSDRLRARQADRGCEA